MSHPAWNSNSCGCECRVSCSILAASDGRLSSHQWRKTSGSTCLTEQTLMAVTFWRKCSSFCRRWRTTGLYRKKESSLCLISVRSKQDQKFLNKNTHSKCWIKAGAPSQCCVTSGCVRQQGSAVLQWHHGHFNRGHLGCGNVRPLESRRLNFWKEIAPMFNLPDCLCHGTFPLF